MNEMDKIIKEFTDLLTDIFGTDIEVLKVDASKIAAKTRAKVFKNMIVDTEKTLNEINNNPNMNVQDKIKSLSTIMLNASIVDADDMNILKQKEAEDYLNMIKVTRNKLNNIMLYIQNNINCLKNEMTHPKEEDEDLTKLSKEELIARLRSMK